LWAFNGIYSLIILAVKRQPRITSLVPNPAESDIGMVAASKKLHIISFSLYSLSCSNYAKIRIQKVVIAEFVLTVARTIELDYT
jgi:hypothetical protein